MSTLSSFYSYISDFNTVSVILRLVLAVIVGGVIGSERGKHGSAAGLRTHILVCVGSAITSLTGLYISCGLGLQGDVMRLPAQVISGIGFLGAGMIIIKNSSSVTGLTTAAGMWATATIGVALGYGFYIGALIGMLGCVFTAAFLTRLERKRKMSHIIYAEISEPEMAGSITDKIRSHINGDMLLEIIPAKSGTTGNLGVLITITNSENYAELRSFIEEIEGIFFVVAE